MPWTSLRVPASSANLGPGFDSLGMALGIYLDCRFCQSEKLQIRVEGRDAGYIPLGKGLGSSAAALTAGVVIADLLLKLDWRRLRILNEAARIEGHPDNVA